jgi:hypothetical protein
MGGTGRRSAHHDGLNLDYPSGKPDTAERGSDSPRWRSVPVSGNNFPDAFMGTMGALQCFAEGSISTLSSHFEDAFQTWRSSRRCIAQASFPASRFRSISDGQPPQ